MKHISEYNELKREEKNLRIMRYWVIAFVAMIVLFVVIL